MTAQPASLLLTERMVWSGPTCWLPRPQERSGLWLR